MVSSRKETDRVRTFWDRLAVYGPERSVIDPRDRLGRKTAYIRQLIFAALERGLANLPKDSLVLDFGCGTGQNFPLLSRLDHRPVGLDISFPLLLHSPARENGRDILRIQYDGKRVPLRTNRLDAIISYVVFNYIVDDEDLVDLSRELNRVLKPGHLLFVIEQTRRKDTLVEDGIKRQRSRDGFQDLLRQAGFLVRSASILRRGHFPLIYMIRYGLLPQKLFAAVAGLESLLGRVCSTQVLDYAETLFVFEKCGAEWM